jgi:predicted regulator of Ras-like GTPase activity (Roadblock/LC7/MglB family)
MFVETLRDIADKLPEADAILLMGIDGLPIEKVIRKQELNIEMLTAEFTTVLRNSNQTASEVNAGATDELIILSEKMSVIMKTITPDYFFMMICNPDANLGRARFELKKAKYLLEKEFV